MTMMRFNPHSELADLFDDLFGNQKREKMERRQYDCSPSTNILETNDDFKLQVAIPGVKKEDVKIDLEKNILNISSEKKAEETTKENEKYTRQEFAFGTFCRSFTLPETIDTDKIKAEVKDGILTVTLPKKEETRISKQINIK
ncbi:MAG TPA: Hsp20/alpha crystallin family protein [Bacteroidales bacterium]|nr:Hsp20/alpha crystallin family protein [Bacteroidales bacterium]